MSNIFPSLFSAKRKGMNRGKILAVAVAIVFISIASFSIIADTASASSSQTYELTVVASGVQPGLTWGFTLSSYPNGYASPGTVVTSVNGTGASELSVSLGTESTDVNYAFTVTYSSGWKEYPSTVYFSVGGPPVAPGNLTAHIAFWGHGVYSAIFQPVPGTTTQTSEMPPYGWAVYFRTTTSESTTTLQTFQDQLFLLTATVTNGTYEWVAGTHGSNDNSNTYSNAFEVIPYEGSFTVSGGPVWVNVTPTLEPRYTVQFSETGLPAGGVFTVDMNNTILGMPWGNATSSYGPSGVLPDYFFIYNGTYQYRVLPYAGYSPSPASDIITVDGSNIDISVVFTSGPQKLYNVTIKEVGLTAGLAWSAVFGGEFASTTSPSMVFSEPNGTYGLSVTSSSLFTATAPSEVTVSGASVTVTVDFTMLSPGQYAVTFMETGLPSGTYWEMTLSGAEKSTDISSVQFIEQNGTYDYSVQSPIQVNGLNYTASPVSGSVTVNGQSKTIDITYGTVSTTKSASGSEYKVTFLESDLPTGSEWYVNFNGVVGSSFNNSIVFYAPAGNYSYAISGPNGYVAEVSMGSITVSKNAAVSVIFSQPNSGGGGVIVRTVQQNWWIIIGLTVLSIVVGWALSVFLNPESKYNKKKGRGSA